MQKCEEPLNKTGQESWKEVLDEKEQIKDIGDGFKNVNDEKKKETDEKENN